MAVTVISSLAPAEEVGNSLDGTPGPGNLTDARMLPDWSSSRHHLETSRGKRKLMLVWPSGQRRVSVVSRRGSPGGAATFAPQVALIRAPPTVSKVWLILFAS